MTEQRLVDYIKKYLSLGHDKDAICGRLVKDGWDAGDIKEAINIAEQQNSQRKRPAKKNFIMIILIILIALIILGALLFIYLKGDIYMKSNAKLSCISQFGMTCSETEGCSGRWISASDTERCCSAACA